MTTTTHSTSSVRGTTLFVAFELGAKQWKVAMAATVGSRPWVRDLTGRRMADVGSLAARRPSPVWAAPGRRRW